MKYNVLFSLLALSFGCSSVDDSFTLSSPDGLLSTTLVVDSLGGVSYNASYDNNLVVGSSRLGLVVDGDSLFSGFRVGEVCRGSIDRLWEMPWGQNKQIEDHHNELTVSLDHDASGRTIQLVFRAFDDALAFRYLIAGGDSVVVDDELSQIKIEDNPQIWWSYADFNTYEKAFMQTRVDSASWIATPSMLRRDDGLHLSLGEASIIGFPDMTLKNLGDGLFKVELTPLRDGSKARVEAPYSTPWRTINIARDAGDILMANTSLNLSPEQIPSDVSTFRPMTYIGVWWDFHLGTREWKEGDRQGATTQSAMRYIDFAAQHGIGGVVVEGWNTGWNTWGTRNDFDYVTSAQDYDLPTVAAYAREKGVRLIMHHETGADVIRYESMMDSAFRLCHRLGITDIKTGHAGRVSINEHHHSQPMVEHFLRIASKASAYGIALNMHEAIKASGLERMYPNLMTREAVRGMEWEAWSEGNPPSHTVTIPFTRGLAGATDYTPGIFDILYTGTQGERRAWNSLTEDLDKYRVHSTLAHQLSLMVTIYSPWVMAADRIESYEGHPAFGFVESLDPDYDQSIVLDCSVGEYIVTARRTGSRWYVGASNNEEARDLTFTLDFLDPDRTYSATLYLDGDAADWVTNPTDYKIERLELSRGDSLTLRLASGGGAALVFE